MVFRKIFICAPFIILKAAASNKYSLIANFSNLLYCPYSSLLFYKLLINDVNIAIPSNNEDLHQSSFIAVIQKV